MRSGLATRPTIKALWGSSRFLGGSMPGISGRLVVLNNVCLIEIYGQAAVVMVHREVERVDATEVVCIDNVLASDNGRLRGAEIAFENLHDRQQDVQARNFDLAAVTFDLGAQLLIDDRVEHDTGSLLDLCQNTGELALGTDERMHVINWPDVGVLDGRGLGDRGQGFAS
jgi:hypothetical protein